MRSIYKNLIVIFTCLPSSFAFMYFTYPVFHPVEKKERVISPLTKFTNNLQNNFKISGAKVDITKANNDESVILDALDTFNIKFTKNDKLTLTFDGDVMITSMNFAGDLKAKFNDKNLLDTDFVYDGSKIYLDLGLDNKSFETSLSFAASSVADLIKVIPMDEISDGDLLSKLGIGEINVSELSNILSTLKDVSTEYNFDETIPNYFKLPLPFIKDEKGEDFSIIFGADEEYKPVKIYTDTSAVVDNFKIDLAVDSLQILDQDYKIPFTPSDKYKDLDPVINGATNIVPQILNLVKTPKLIASLEANLSYQGEEQIAVEGQFDIDAVDNKYDIKLDVLDRKYPESAGIFVDARHQDSTTYIDFNKGILKGSIKNESIDEAIKEVEKLLNKDALTYILSLLDSVVSSEKLAAILDNFSSISKILNTLMISWDNSNIYVSIAAEDIGLESGMITLCVNHDSNGLNYIKITGFEYKDYAIDLKLGLHDYEEMVEINPEEYSKLDSLTSLISIIPDLIKQKEYTLAGNISLKNEDSLENIVDVNLKAQFNLNTNEYYGNAIIADPNNDKHHVDYLYTNQTIYLNYDNEARLNDAYSTKAKIDIASIDETYQMIMNFIYELQGKDEVAEPLKDMLTNLLNNPALFETLRITLFNLDSSNLNLSVETLDSPLEDGTTSIIHLYLNLAMFGLDDIPLNISVGFHKENLTFLSVDPVNISGVGVLSVKFSLTSFDYELENNRLSTNDTYIDFDDLKALLSIGINTATMSVNNYWYISGKVQLDASIITIEVPMKIYVRNNDTKVEIAIQLTIDGDLLSGITGSLIFEGNYSSSGDRYVAIYYYDGVIYIHRSDMVSNGIFSSATRQSTLYSMSLNDALSYEHPLHIFTKDIFTLNDSINSLIDDSMSESTEPIYYEKMIKTFKNDESSKQINISLDMEALTHSDKLKNLAVTIGYVGGNTSSYMLNTLSVNLDIDVGITLGIKANFKLEDLTKDYESYLLPAQLIKEYCTKDGVIYSHPVDYFYQGSALNFGESF